MIYLRSRFTELLLCAGSCGDKVPGFRRPTAAGQCDRAVQRGVWEQDYQEWDGDGSVGSRIRGGHLEEVRLVFSILSRCVE